MKQLYNFKGLTDEEVTTARIKFGKNELLDKKADSLIISIIHILKEPMVLILFAASTIYFITGNIEDGIFLSSAIVLVAVISLFQETRSQNALEKLKLFTQPKCKVIRNGQELLVNSVDVVVGDFIIMEEGDSIIADGKIIRSRDFFVNESILTGESFPLYKNSTMDDNKIYSGTNVTGGMGIAIVSAVGNNTKLGEIGKSIDSIVGERTPLENQITDFVKKMILTGSIIFILVWGINYSRSLNLLESLLQALTLAMSILPEEIPVAFTTFMALGAWRLMKSGIIVKKIKTVETLGSATVICVDKTGTITENQMHLTKLFLLPSNSIFQPEEELSEDAKKLIEISMWASEPTPFDPMEIAIHKVYQDVADKDLRNEYELIHEYPLEGKPPMMTHIFANEAKHQIIACKGAPEAVMKVSALNIEEIQKINTAIQNLASEGYRLLGVGFSTFNNQKFPETQFDLPFHFLGMIAFYDPPKKNISTVLENFYTAGIQVKIITGDNALTSAAIAKQIGFKGFDKSISGEELMKLESSDLLTTVIDKHLFTRMFPEAKLKIINALKANHQIVAMTGDGVNDGPALKAANIGIAMGIKGTEIAKQAASLILLKDDLSKMVDAIAMGRKIYINLKKAIQYIISIHIPIILTVFIPLAAGWKYPNIFSPVHIIFLELIMGPTCSIIYENEPIEKNAMNEKPRPLNKSIFRWNELSVSILQGLVITLGTLLTYQYAILQGFDENLTRTMIFTVLIVANIFLTLINRSFIYSTFVTLKHKNNLVPGIIAITFLLMALILYVKPLNTLFKFTPLSGFQLFFCCLTGFLSVIWFEVLKFFKRQNLKLN